METVGIKLGRICIASLSDGTRGRFDSRDKDTLYVSLKDNFGVFHKGVGTIEEMNKSLEKFEVVLEYIE